MSLTPAVARPPHVPEALVYDFDMQRDPQLAVEPHERYRQLLAEAPEIFWTPRCGGHWMLNRHALAFEAARDCDAFSSALTTESEAVELQAQMPGGARVPLPVPICSDPPIHASFRLPLNAPFAPKSIAALQEAIRSLAASLVDKVADAGRCEFIGQIAEPFPVQVFLRLLGLPLENQGEYRALVKTYLSMPGNERAALARLQVKMVETMRTTILARREQPADDVISRLWRSEIDGRPPSLEDMENYCVLLFIAGLDTVMNALGFGLRHMAIDQQMQARLRADPSLIPEAVEELMRRYTFVTGVRRVAKDLEFHGVTMKRGERLMLNLPAADLDPAHWPDPAKVDLDRADKTHIAFNAGPHRCVGSHLARMELQTLYREFLARVPTFRLDPEKPPVFHGGVVMGLDRLDLTWS